MIAESLKLKGNFLSFTNKIEIIKFVLETIKLKDSLLNLKGTQFMNNVLSEIIGKQFRKNKQLLSINPFINEIMTELKLLSTLYHLS